jgi:hypothetical protein
VKTTFFFCDFHRRATHRSKRVQWRDDRSCAPDARPGFFD